MKAYDSEVGLYTLDYPNREVKESMDVFLLGAYSHHPIDAVRPNVLHIMQACGI